MPLLLPFIGDKCWPLVVATGFHTQILSSRSKELKAMDPGEFVFIQEMGTGSHRPMTKSLIKMHVMDRVVMKRRAPKEESSHGRDRAAEPNRE